MARNEALPTLKRVYRRYSEPRNLLLHRPDATWSFGVLRSNEAKRPTQVALHRDAAGEVTGYVVYQLERRLEQEDHLLSVTDFVALDARAHAGLWDFLLAHDLVGRIRMDAMPPHDPSPLLVEEPRRLGRRLRDAIYLRVVDAERALALRPYAAEDRLLLQLSRDELCPWNAGTFALESGSGEVRVSRSSAPPQLVLPPRSLASLLCGHASATALARAGLLDARDPSVLQRADRLFATAYPPFCGDGF